MYSLLIQFLNTLLLQNSYNNCNYKYDSVINSCVVNCVVTELDEAYEVFKNKQGVLTTDLPLVSSSLGIPVTDPEITIRDATG